jgi:thiol-disulfide isomerase/thioredoxin
MTHAPPQPARSRHGWLRQSAWVLLLFVVLVAFHRYRTTIRLVPAGEAPLVGELTLRDTDGRTLTLRERRGEVVLINLWASWCGPCRREVPRLSRLYRKLEPEGLTVWAINAELFEGDELRRVTSELGIDYPTLTVVGELGAALDGGEVLPFTWLIDRQGRLRASHGGLASEAALQRACRDLLDEPGDGS